MNKLSTKNLKRLLDIKDLQNLCKSISALEAIICPEWEYRYYSYNNQWDDAEECCEMRDGSGDHMLILFNKYGAVINGFAHESKMNGWKSVTIKKNKTFTQKLFNLKNQKTVEVQEIRKGVVDSLPKEFHQFIFGEPVKSIGTTFCIWKKFDDTMWKTGNIDFPDDGYSDGSGDLLQLLDGSPMTYKNWAMEYYEEEFEKSELELDFVRKVYKQTPITRKMVKQVNPQLDDFDALKSDLDEIGYKHKL
ncbi:MAG: hypothetical protein GY754_45390 [bacterium]|nr:hypothetical protein [bacterium]